VLGDPRRRVANGLDEVVDVLRVRTVIEAVGVAAVVGATAATSGVRARHAGVEVHPAVGEARGFVVRVARIARIDLVTHAAVAADGLALVGDAVRVAVDGPAGQCGNHRETGARF